MRTLLISSLLLASLAAQTTPSKNPLGNTRFPPAKDLDWKAKPATMTKLPALEAKEPNKAEIGQARHTIVLQLQPQPTCAHVKRVKPSPLADPKMVIPMPAGNSNMPVVKTMPACDEVR